MIYEISKGIEDHEFISEEVSFTDQIRLKTTGHAETDRKGFKTDYLTVYLFD